MDTTVVDVNFDTNASKRAGGARVRRYDVAQVMALPPAGACRGCESNMRRQVHKP